MDKICITVPSKPEYVQTLRLVTASVANRFGFDIEEIEDLRVCVSEAFNDRLMDESSSTGSNVNEIAICIEADDQVFKIHISGESKFSQNKEDAQMRLLILSSLLDDVIETSEGITLMKKRHVSR